MKTLFEPLDFSQTRILVSGDLMLDQYWIGETSRISPEAPVPVVKIGSTDNRLGGAANAALNAKSLGAQVSLNGIIGEDSNATILSQLITESRIENLSVNCQQAQTISKLRLISRNQQMLRADFESEFSEDAITRNTRTCINNIDNCDIVLLSDYNKGSLHHCQKIIQAANKANKKVIIDPKGTDFSRYKNAYLLTPNLSEFEAVVGKCRNEQDLFKKAHDLITQLNLQALLLTRSAQGMTLFKACGSHHHFNAKAQEVYDVTGAGDTVIATLATALAANVAIEQAVLLANTAAGIVVGRMGAATVTPLEIKLALENNGARSTGIITPEPLQKLVNFEQSLNKKVVFTNGCFDILHSGHVQYLSEARALGDRLIVAINSDESVKRLKGEQRPINTIDDRMAVISSLACVDWVLSFNEDTPESLLQLIKPDILAKGGDYRIHEVVGADIVIEAGGSVAVLSLHEGVSTTNIIDSIKSK